MLDYVLSNIWGALQKRWLQHNPYYVSVKMMCFINFFIQSEYIIIGIRIKGIF